MKNLRNLIKRSVTQQRFNLKAIRNGFEVTRLQHFSNGDWVNSQGSHENIPNPLNKERDIAQVPILDLAEERAMFKESMQKVATLRLTRVPQIRTAQFLQRPSQIQRNRRGLPQAGESLARERHRRLLHRLDPTVPRQIRAAGLHGVPRHPRLR